jgi:hypothetical protein
VLRDHDVRDVPMPATPVRVWQAMQGGEQVDGRRVRLLCQKSFTTPPLS